MKKNDWEEKYKEKGSQRETTNKAVGNKKLQGKWEVAGKGSREKYG